MSSGPPKPEYVVFMSNDKYSANFMNKLRTKEELMKKFNVVDINRIPTIPNEINEVPCVYDGKQIYQGKQAFEWLVEKMAECLSAADDGLMYSFLDGQEEKVFGNYSFIEQKNGSYGMGENGSDPSRPNQLNNNENKNRTLDSLMAARSSEIKPLNKPM